MYRSSNMVLDIHSNASYLEEYKEWSILVVHHILLRNSNLPPNNAAVLNISQIIKAVMSSADESKLGALFIIVKYEVLVRKTL